MKNVNKTKKYVTSVFIVFIMMVMIIESWSPIVYGTESRERDTVLAFTSDVHNKEETGAVSRLVSWIDKVEEMYGGIDEMSFCGDMANGKDESLTKDYWPLVQECMDAVDEKGIDAIYTTGNHEYKPGNFGQISNSAKARFTLNSEAAVGDNYRIYCLGTEGGNYFYSVSQIEKLSSYLKQAGNDKPIFIVTHFPLHNYRNRSTTNADKLINTINKATTNNTPNDKSDDKTIVFIWGHNHTIDDVHYDGIYKPKAKVQYDPFGNYKTLNFYYAAAGCMSDSDYSIGSGFVKGKGLVVTIDSKNNLNFAYHNTNGKNVTEVTPRIAKTTKPIIAAKGIASGKNAVNISWNKIGQADRYEVYLAKCNTSKKKYKFKKVKTLNGKTYKWKKTGLSPKTYYKFYVVAKKKYGNEYRTIARSKDGHFITSNNLGAYTNPKSLTLSKYNITLKKGQSSLLKGSVAKYNKKKKLATSHAELLRFVSSDMNIAVVNEKGKITAKGKGSCKIYVQTINGIWKICNVSVK